MPTSTKNYEFSIIIATHHRATLLERLLESLRSCSKPEQLAEILVIENGEIASNGPMVETYSKELPIRHIHHPIANKSSALNEGLKHCQSDYVVFFDDDVLVDPNCLIAYDSAIRENPTIPFFAGNCQVAYETPPPQWLFQYLPDSAKGWNLGPVNCELDRADGLGFNWAANRNRLVQVGGFDTGLGPGNPIPVGDETEIQERLLKEFGNALYVAGAIVTHAVPDSRCSLDWTLQRAQINARRRALKYRPKTLIGRTTKRFISFAKHHILCSLARCLQGKSSTERTFARLHKAQKHKGIVEGTKFDPASPPPVPPPIYWDRLTRETLLTKE